MVENIIWLVWNIIWLVGFFIAIVISICLIKSYGDKNTNKQNDWFDDYDELSDLSDGYEDKY